MLSDISAIDQAHSSQSQNLGNDPFQGKNTRSTNPVIKHLQCSNLQHVAAAQADEGVTLAPSICCRLQQSRKPFMPQTL